MGSHLGFVVCTNTFQTGTCSHLHWDFRFLTGGISILRKNELPSIGSPNKSRASLKPNNLKSRSKPVLISSLGGHCLLLGLKVLPFTGPESRWLLVQSLFQGLAGLGFVFSRCSGCFLAVLFPWLLGITHGLLLCWGLCNNLLFLIVCGCVFRHKTSSTMPWSWTDTIWPTWCWEKFTSWRGR